MKGGLGEKMLDWLTRLGHAKMLEFGWESVEAWLGIVTIS